MKRNFRVFLVAVLTILPIVFVESKNKGMNEPESKPHSGIPEASRYVDFSNKERQRHLGNKLSKHITGNVDRAMRKAEKAQDDAMKRNFGE